MSFEINLLTKRQCFAFRSYFPLVPAEIFSIWTPNQGKLVKCFSLILHDFPILSPTFHRCKLNMP